MKIKKISLSSSSSESGFIDISLDSQWACDWYAKLLNDHAKECKAKVIQIACSREPVTQAAKLSNGVLSTSIAFDTDQYRKMSLGRRKAIIADAIHECLLRNSRVIGITRRAVSQCARRIQDEGLLRSWSGPKVRSTDRNMSAQMEYVHDIHAFVACLRIDDSRGRVIQRVTVGVEMPDALVFRRLIGKIRWFRDGSIKVAGSHGTLFSTKPSKSG